MKIKNLNDIPSLARYFQRIGAEPRSLRTAVVKELKGKYWEDIAIISVESNGKVIAPDAYAPTDRERSEIEIECQNFEWPKLKFLKALVDLPDEVKTQPPENVFEFRDIHNNIVMLQVRIDDAKGGEKRYHPWTFWDDNQWRKAEPEGFLPLWGMDQFSDGRHTTVFIHEGAKAARAVREMVESQTPAMKQKLQSHPWGEELNNAAHVGWIGGALSPSRTDWSALKKAGVKRAYIVSDNDLPGVQAVQAISFQLRVPTFHLQFTSEWPQSFDLADEFPAAMFKKMEGREYYVGPSFRSCLHPATWATDQIPNPRGKPTTALRSNFKDMWAYVEEADLFVCKEMPEIIRSEQIMNKMLSPFSHTSETSKLIVKAYVGRSTKMCYRPDIRGKIVTDNTTSAINLHTPTHIKSRPGSAEPFIEFMQYMFPNQSELKEVLRWCSTLIARPETRMEYGLLLVSERQGVGKTTLGASILAPLVGVQNAGYPTENQIVQSEFNGWLANKRLIVINEIYSGQSWKAYNKLKSAITDKEVEVNEKYQRPYLIENWCHIFACSNSMRALKIEEDDRRWYYPEVTEDKWPSKKFEQFHDWLRSGGLSIIKNWAENQKDYVSKGQPAPMTERKKELIASSRTDGQQEATVLAEMLKRKPQPVVLAMKDIVEWVRSSIQGRLYDTDLEIRKAMKEVGAYWYEERILISGRLQMAAMNEAALEKLRQKHPLRIVKNNVSLIKSVEDQEETNRMKSEIYSEIRNMLKTPNDITESTM